MSCRKSLPSPTVLLVKVANHGGSNMKKWSESAVSRCPSHSNQTQLAIPDGYHPHSSITHGAGSGLKTKHRRVMRLQHLAVSQIHVDTARQARIEASDRPHDVDSFELIRAIFFKDRSVLHRVLVRTRSAISVARIGIPGGRRIRMIVGDLAFFDHDMMREHAADSFMESTANSLLGHLEFRPGFCVSSVQ